MSIRGSREIIKIISLTVIFPWFMTCAGSRGTSPSLIQPSALLSSIKTFVDLSAGTVSLDGSDNVTIHPMNRTCVSDIHANACFSIPSAVSYVNGVLTFTTTISNLTADQWTGVNLTLTAIDDESITAANPSNGAGPGGWFWDVHDVPPGTTSAPVIMAFNVPKGKNFTVRFDLYKNNLEIDEVHRDCDTGELIIIGKNLGDDPGERSRATVFHNIVVNGAIIQNDQVLSWEDTRITARLGKGVTDGFVAVTKNGQPSGKGHIDPCPPPPPASCVAALSWTQPSLSGAKPDVRESSTGIFDTSNHRMLVFGGLTRPTYNRLNDVWAMTLSHADQATWTQLTPAGSPPPPRNAHSAVYDSGHSRMIIFSGAISDSQLINDTWALDLAGGGNGTWTQLWPNGCTTCPQARGAHTAIYDSANDRMIIYAGNTTISTGLPPSFNDVWALDLAAGGSGTWTQLIADNCTACPHRRGSQSAIYDPANQRMVVFGGGYWPSSYSTSPPFVSLNDVWTLSLGGGGTPVWTQLTPSGTPPPPRIGHKAAYDSVNNRMLIFGGSGGQWPNNYPLNDLWALSLTSGSESWVQLNPGGTPPPARWGHATAFDPLVGKTFVFSGSLDASTDSNDLWSLVPCPPLPPPASACSWTFTSSLNAARWGADAVAANGSVYIMGGYTTISPTSSFLSSVERAPVNSSGGLDPFTYVSSLNVARFAPSIGVGGWIYTIGGWNGSEVTSIEQSVINPDGSLDPWKIVGSISSPRWGHEAINTGSSIYVLGGYHAGSLLSIVEYARVGTDGSLGSWTTTSSLNTPRDIFALAESGGYLYVAGGLGSGSTILTGTEYSHINADGSLGPWIQGPSLTTPRWGPRAFVLDGWLYVAGGQSQYNNTDYLSTMEKAPINPDGSLGQFIPTQCNLNVARSSFGMVLVSGHAIALGGANDQTLPTGLSSAELY